MNVLALDILSDISAELAEVDNKIATELKSKQHVLQDASTYLLKAGGKRIRPALVFLSGKFYNYVPEKLLPLAAAVEMIHMATLVHDDVIDGAATRRGIPTVNRRWNERVSVLAGDYLFAKSFSLLASTGDERVVKVMADVVFEMCTGEMAQLTYCYDCSQTIDDYLSRIEKKTAYFIAECCRLGAWASEAPEEAVEALAGYGWNIGMGFQIVDDILDFTSDAAVLGKPIGSDLREGVITLPVIHALSHPVLGKRLRKLLETRAITDIEMNAVLNVLREAGSLEYSYDTARAYIREAKRCLEILPELQAKENLLFFADFIVSRRF